MLKRIFAAGILALLLNTPAYADFNDGVFAYAKGDYEMAFNTMMPLSQNTNHPYAQYYLGVMFSKGQGVEQNDETAADWFLKASKQGVKEAQYRLANMYSKGKGVPQDYEAAYAWYKVASHLEHKKSMAAIEQAKTKLTNEELAAAQQLADDYIMKYGTAPDLDKKKQ